MKPRILYCGEFSLLNTGYAVYGRELLKRLYASGKYEVAELAAYLSADDPRYKQLPWKVYPTIPPEGSKEKEQYNPNSNDQFGAAAFDNVCLHFKPHVVIDIRDFWMFEHESTSPARPYYNWFIMPTVDSHPQSEQWLSTYASADAVFTYQDWSLNVLNKDGGGKIKTVCSAPPVADYAYYPISYDDIPDIKTKFGLANKRIVGTVMRNQGRKLFPHLFEAFSKFKKMHSSDNVVLYCHTSYPDVGWDIPKYLHKYGISNSVYFTYVCPKETGGCGEVFPALFSDTLTACQRCKRPNARFASTHHGVDNHTMAVIYNMFDLYIQYSNSEGFGMPQVEAAACGVPISGIDFSAMEDILDKLGGYKLPPLCLEPEIETGCLRAVPNSETTALFFSHYFSKSDAELRKLKFDTRMNFEKHYSSWDKTAEKWMAEIDKVDISLLEKKWSSGPNIHSPSTNIPKQCSNSEFARFLIVDVLGKPEYVNGYMEARLIRDLNFGQAQIGMNGVYFNEMGALFNKPTYTDFTRDIAYRHFVSLALKRNEWEKIRYENFIRSSL